MKKIHHKTLYLFCLILLSTSILTAQNTTANIQWTTLETPKKDLSFAVPENFLIDNEDGQHNIFAYHNQVRVNVSIDKGESPKNRIKSFRAFPVKTEAQISHFELGDFIGDVYKLENEKTITITVYAASSRAFYTIVAISEDNSSSTFEKFIYSIKLNGKPLFDRKNSMNEMESPRISIESLNTSPVILEVLKNKSSKKARDAKKYEIKYETEVDKTVEENKNYSRPLIVLRKTQPRYSDSARNSNISGDVKLKVHFQANGEIGAITVISKLERGLEKNAIEAASKIKFLPAEIDGKSVDVFKEIIYTFTVY